MWESWIGRRPWMWWMSANLIPQITWQALTHIFYHIHARKTSYECWLVYKGCDEWLFHSFMHNTVAYMLYAFHTYDAACSACAERLPLKSILTLAVQGRAQYVREKYVRWHLGHFCTTANVSCMNVPVAQRSFLELCQNPFAVSISHCLLLFWHFHLHAFLQRLPTFFYFTDSH